MYVCGMQLLQQVGERIFGIRPPPDMLSMIKGMFGF